MNKMSLKICRRCNKFKQFDDKWLRPKICNDCHIKINKHGKKYQKYYSKLKHIHEVINEKNKI